MRILYGVNGEGMGHATRSKVVIDALLPRHDVRVVASGAAFAYLRDRLPRVDEILGPSFAMDQGEIRHWATLRRNLVETPRDFPDTVKRWITLIDEWHPDVVITDFEPLSARFARATQTPLVSVNNINMIDRCRHHPEIIGGERRAYALALSVVRAMIPTAGDYIVPTFFRPPVTRGRTTLVPPILRPEIATAEPEHGEHLVVYSSGDERLLEALRSTGVRCLIYGMRERPQRGAADGSLELRPRSNEGFVEDLRTARGVIAGGGFSLLSEAVYLGKPTLSIPLRGQFEQLMNARYLAREGFGVCATEVSPEVVDGFLAELDRFRSALGGYEQVGSSVALRTIEDRATAAAAEGRASRRRARRAARRRTQ